YRESRTGDEAVDREREERVRREVPHQESNREVRGYAGEQAPDDHLADDPLAVWPREVRELVDARRQDYRGGEQEREARGVLVVHPTNQPRDHRYPGAAYPRKEREDLRGADDGRFVEPERLETSRRAAIIGASRGARRGPSFGAPPIRLPDQQDEA